MNEIELLECLHMRTLTDDKGERHLMSVPITQHVTELEKERLSGHKMIGLKCSQISPEVLAVIEEPEFF